MLSLDVDDTMENVYFSSFMWLWRVYKKRVRRWKNNQLFSVFEVIRRFLCRCYQAGAHVTVRRKPSTADHKVCIHTMSIKELLIFFSVSMLMRRLSVLYWSLCRVSFNKSQKTSLASTLSLFFHKSLFTFHGRRLGPLKKIKIKN